MTLVRLNSGNTDHSTRQVPLDNSRQRPCKTGEITLLHFVNHCLSLSVSYNTRVRSLAQLNYNNYCHSTPARSLVQSIRAWINYHQAVGHCVSSLRSCVASYWYYSALSCDSVGIIVTLHRIARIALLT